MSTVITGIGAVTPNGLGAEEFWKATLAGHNAVKELTGFDVSKYASRLAGQITDYDAKAHLPSRLLPQTDVSTRYALTAAAWALENAGVTEETLPDYDMGTVTSNALGGFEFTHQEFNKLWSKGSEFVSVYESFAWFYAVNTGQISIRHKLRGPSAALVGEQAGGLDAIGHARRTVRRGTKLVVSGGVDAAFDPWGWASQLAGGLVSTAADPEAAYLPFDERAAGYVPGEGGAILIAEDSASALERGAPQIYGEIAGYASTFDPKPESGREPGLRRAAELAIEDAGLVPADIDVVFADASGLPDKDREEAAALRAIFGVRGVAVTAPKALTGRMYAGGGPADLVAALLSIRDGVIPASGHSSRIPEEYGIDLVVGEPRTKPVGAALVLARGRWGFNSAVVVTRHSN
ncbi:ketosynthase chain-length factor [Streptomyces triculaminicus]|uniref:ketosynthase chain-length factor n=1 Tax=Streptomyces triculaminicus TaxID=2816232 RepID=UPI003403849D